MKSRNALLGKEATSLNFSQPARGEIWLVNFDPTVGTEIRKKRPAIVISSDAVGLLPIKLVAPLTDWKDYFEGNIWHVKIEPNLENALSKVSAVDALQLRGMDMQRFITKIGRIEETALQEILFAIVSIIEFVP